MHIRLKKECFKCIIPMKGSVCMLLNNFKVSGFKVFGDIVELSMNPGTKNTTYLKENIIESKTNGKSSKNLKTSIIYGGNNTGKSSLLEAIITMKQVFIRGNASGFPFDQFKNFCFEYGDVIRFELDFNNSLDNYIYGIEFSNNNSIGEYLYLNDELLFSRDLNGESEGQYIESSKDFKNAVNNLTINKLIIPYFLDYQKNNQYYEVFIVVKNMFDKIIYVDNKRNDFSINILTDFMNDSKKVSVLNELIMSTELYLEGRKIITDEELFKTDYYKNFTSSNDVRNFSESENNKEGFKKIVETLKVTSLYRNKDGELLNKPSVMFDSIGTNKFLNLSMYIINALMEGSILLVDEFDSSLHHKLTRVLVILMNSEANKNSQFILTTHDVNLLSSKLFRKDQINFVTRNVTKVEIVSLDDFKANSNRDIRNTTNFENFYVEEKIIPLPETNIYAVIKELLSEEK